MLVREVVDRFPGRVGMAVQNWGDSPIAKRLGVKGYPAVFVAESVFATPRDLGFYPDGGGRYTPWRDPASHERFKSDLDALLRRLLSGDPAGAPAAGGAVAAPEIARLPELVLEDLEGRGIPTASLRGRAVIVEFWATWCPPCRATLPWLASLKKSRGGDLEVLAVAVESPPEEVRAVAAAEAAGLTVVTGTAGIAAAFGNVSAVPTMLLFDARGDLVRTFYGAPDGLHARVEEALRLAGR